jgi:hypothetical protein
MNDTPISKFEKVAASQPGSNIFSDLWYFLWNSKKWWLLPTTAVAPFIYTLF